jgi:hypothetical protein
MEADSAEGSFATPPSLRTDSFCHLALYLQTELEAATAVPGQRVFFLRDGSRRTVNVADGSFATPPSTRAAATHPEADQDVACLIRWPCSEGVLERY